MTDKSLKKQLDEAKLIIKERTYSLKMAHLHLRNYSDYIEELEARLGETSLPIPGHRFELGVTKQQRSVWYGDMDVRSDKQAKVVARRAKVAKLTKAGITRADIAKQLDISIRTVSGDKKAIKRESDEK